MRSSRGLTKRTERPGHPGRSRFGSLLLVDHRLSDLRHLATNEPSANVYLDGETTLYTIHLITMFQPQNLKCPVFCYYKEGISGSLDDLSALDGEADHLLSHFPRLSVRSECLSPP